MQIINQKRKKERKKGRKEGKNVQVWKEGNGVGNMKDWKVRRKSRREQSDELNEDEVTDSYGKK